MVRDSEAWQLLIATGLPLIVGAAVLCAVAIVLLRPLLVRYAMARPNARSSHRVPTPQGGGIAVVGATLLLTALAAWLTPALGAAALATLAPLLLAAAFLAVVGGVDDIRPIAVLPRLTLQGVAVATVVLLLPEGMRVLPMLPVPVERVFLVIGGLWFVNLVNFMDGLDWMTVAEAVPITAGLIALGVTGTLPLPALTLATALFGAMLGFAPFNRPVARLFLGDVGSLPIGLMLGWLLLMLAGNGHLAAALLLPLYYLADATLTLLRRLAAGDSVLQAHRGHFYQRATDKGWRVWQIVAAVFATNILLALLALASVWFDTPVALVATLALGVLLVAALLAALTRERR